MADLTIVGLGPAGPELLTREAVEALAQAPELYVRTRRHPTVRALPFTGRLRSFDRLYRNAAALDAVYEGIARSLARLAGRPGGVVYAVPGHPLVGEHSVRLALEQAHAAGRSVRIVAGLSFVEPTLAALAVDPLAAGLQVLDAAALVAEYFGIRQTRDPFAIRARPFDATRPSLIAQVDRKLLVSGLKLVLLEWLPPDHRVALVSGAGGPSERVRWRELHALDRGQVDHLTSLYVPPLEPHLDSATLDGLRSVVTRLRAPAGCPWDREQTHNSLKKELVEETYEVVDAIERGARDGDWAALAEELGDLLMNVLLHAQIAAEDGTFWLEDILRGINAKLIRRHPHVFGDVTVASSADVLANWDRIKRQEKDGQPEASRLGEVPRALPSLLRAQTLERRARRAGFAWADVDGAWVKLEEEIGELRAARSPDDVLEEVGDVLWMAVTVAGYLGVDADEALSQAATRFERRFRALEAAVGPGDLGSIGIERLLSLWRQAKAQG